MTILSSIRDDTCSTRCSPRVTRSPIERLRSTLDQRKLSRRASGRALSATRSKDVSSRRRPICVCPAVAAGMTQSASFTVYIHLPSPHLLSMDTYTRVDASSYPFALLRAWPCYGLHRFFRLLLPDGGESRGRLSWPDVYGFSAISLFRIFIGISIFHFRSEGRTSVELLWRYGTGIGTRGDSPSTTRDYFSRIGYRYTLPLLHTLTVALYFYIEFSLFNAVSSYAREREREKEADDNGVQGCGYYSGLFMKYIELSRACNFVFELVARTRSYCDVDVEFFEFFWLSFIRLLGFLFCPKNMIQFWIKNFLLQ